ncbi:three-Cys-motif partner protein TcmP [Algoriphagus halophytocola]|uniref:three-Cys-motif partner protein TcmP n=1 Tax=Algoriphagus halophytocola TaxID=2991499 RepID=UPI0022DD5D32|nr:three-Cys-motif partner protein TcmP [Algoriphagus sp. TR-M9]WBL43017.1 three-Cys-motif partner protein TcmP [Algoriphagus sp. TR-M9]
MKESQSTMFEHSEVKVRLLNLYIQKYLNILSRAPGIEKVHLYDLFCGEGIYDNGGEGSPIIFLKAIKNLYFRNQAEGQKIIKIDCVFNDIQEWKTEKVKKAVADKKLHYPFLGDLRFRNVDYQKTVPLLVDQVNRSKKSKAFVFIDPYGYKEVRASQIKSILETKKSEVLLFLPTQFMFRFEKKGIPEALQAFIEDLVPKDKWPNSHTGISFIENLKSAFRNYLGDQFFVDTFIISRDINQYFCLFFFTNHIYGFDKMLEAKWQIDAEEGRGWTYKNPDLPTLFESSPTIKVNKLEAYFLEFLKESKTNAQIYEATLHQGFRPTHAIEVLKGLAAQNKIIVTPSDGQKVRKGSYYINYRDFCDRPGRISIKLT